MFSGQDRLLGPLRLKINSKCNKWISKNHQNQLIHNNLGFINKKNDLNPLNGFNFKFLIKICKKIEKTKGRKSQNYKIKNPYARKCQFHMVKSINSFNIILKI